MTTVSEVSIGNMALTQLKANPIIDLNDESDAAYQVSLWYPIARDAVLEDSDWTFAIKRATATPLVEAPVFGYGKRFVLPADCIRVISVSDNANYDENGIDWRKEENFIVSDIEKAYIRYVKRITDAQKFSPGFVIALSVRLAAHLAIPITGSRGLYNDKMNEYMGMLEMADGNDGRQGKSDRLGTKSNILRNR